MDYVYGVVGIEGGHYQGTTFVPSGASAAGGAGGESTTGEGGR